VAVLDPARTDPARTDPAAGGADPAGRRTRTARTRTARTGTTQLAGAAALIAVLTVLSRLAGFARIVVFSGAVGQTSLGNAYQAANTIPNIIFELVAGGALAALVVPLVAGPLARGDRAAAGATAAALLGWVLVLLVPLAVLVALAARPVTWLLLGGADPAALDSGARMLRVFAPQIPLYGVGIVLAGVLQAHRRFAWPVLAPLLSSLVVIATYLVFAATQPRHVDLPRVGRGGELVLSVGTTLGVVVLSLCLVPPVRRLRLPWRPTLRFAAGTGRSVRGLAAVGAVTVGAQQLSLALTIALIGHTAVPGAVVLFTQAQTLYLLPWAVLAVPVATSVYPALSASSATRDEARFAGTLAGATRGVLLLSGLGAAGLAAVAWPAAWLLSHVTRGTPDVARLAAALLGFAPGLLGYGLFALHSRALYARAEHRSAALAAVAGWGAVALASVGLALAVPGRDRVPAMTAANSVGMVVLGAVLVLLVRRRIGPAALAGVGRAGLAAVLAGLAAGTMGTVARLPLPGTPDVLVVLLAGMLSGSVAAVVFAAVAVLVDRADAGPVLARLREGVARLRGRVGRRRPEGRYR
jgi:putative peptidoglycan lipid II flippase